MLTRARAHAAAGGLAALSLFADRLEGLAALATGDPVVGAQRLLTARDGLATLGAAFERARTEVHLSRAFRELGRADEAADCEGKAVAEFERLGVVRPW